MTKWGDFMNNQKGYEDVKEVESIISEKEEIQRLLRECRWDELSMHLQNLSSKYLAEKIVYNTVNPNPPKTLQENAANCISFLDTLLATKTIKKDRQTL